MHVAVREIVSTVAVRFRVREGEASPLPPHRVAREIERPGETANVCERRPKWLRDHLQRSDSYLVILERRIFNSYQREEAVDVVKARFFLISVLHLQQLEPSLGAKRDAHCVLCLRGSEIRRHRPRCADRKITLGNRHVAEPNPSSPRFLLRSGGSRCIARENALVVP